MVITILEAQVAPEKAAILEAEFKAAVGELEPGLRQTFLLRSFKDPAAWKIVTVWESREALEQMRRISETPKGVLMFRAAGAEPALSVQEIVAQSGWLEADS